MKGKKKRKINRGEAIRTGSKERKETKIKIKNRCTLRMRVHTYSMLIETERRGGAGHMISTAQNRRAYGVQRTLDWRIAIARESG